MSLKSKIFQSKSIGVVIITIIYILATIIGVITYNSIDCNNKLLSLFIADVVATLVVWLFGVIFNNSSIYDPYWSVAPPLLLTFFAIEASSFGTPVRLTLLIVWLWAIRLTGNWAYTFSNLSKQDWRYDKYKGDFPKLWHLVNLFGINLMPTLIVFLAMIPAIELIDLNPISYNIFTILGILISLVAVALELVSDIQAHSFRKENRGKVCNIGLWKSSRHPNYLGEILFWWGLFIIYISVAPGEWLTAIGAVANTLLFIFVSIPLMEKRQLATKPAYAEYRRNTRML